MGKRKPEKPVSYQDCSKGAIAILLKDALVCPCRHNARENGMFRALLSVARTPTRRWHHGEVVKEMKNLDEGNPERGINTVAYSLSVAWLRYSRRLKDTCLRTQYQNVVPC